MTPAQLAALRAEVLNDPAALGYAGLPSGTIVHLLTLQNLTAVKAISASVAFSWAALGPYARIVDAAATGSGSPVRAECLVVRDALLAGLDIDMPNLQPLFTAMVNAGVVTQPEHDALIVLATRPASRLDQIGLPGATEEDLRQALA